MSQEIPILIEPSLGVDSTDLKSAWDGDPDARKLGRLETRPAGQQFTGFVELVVIPLAVGVATELLKEPAKEIVKETIAVIRRLLAAKLKAPVSVDQQSLPDGKQTIVVQKK